MGKYSIYETDMQQAKETQETVDKRESEGPTEVTESMGFDNTAEPAEDIENGNNSQGSGEEGKELTMAERKKKLDQLRNRMVRWSSLLKYIFSRPWSHHKLSFLPYIYRIAGIFSCKPSILDCRVYRTKAYC